MMTDIISNFDAKVWGMVSSASAAGESWSAAFDGNDETQISTPKQHVEISVVAPKVKINEPQDGSKGVKVAELRIMVLPAI